VDSIPCDGTGCPIRSAGTAYELGHVVLHVVLHVAASLRDADVSLGETDLRARSDYAADRIADESEIRRSKSFLRQYFAAYSHANVNVLQPTIPPRTSGNHLVDRYSQSSTSMLGRVASMLFSLVSVLRSARSTSARRHTLRALSKTFFVDREEWYGKCNVTSI
jgi:hypothetical protein